MNRTLIRNTMHLMAEVTAPLLHRTGARGGIVLIFLLCLFPLALLGQIKIGGNVYGGGNQANVGGSTSVRVCAGDLNNVFGGARMANVGGNTIVNIDGEHATGHTLITSVYGGNDISGTIGTAEDVKEQIPSVLTEVLTGKETKETNPEKNEIDNTWNAYVRTSRSTTIEEGKTVENYTVLIGNLFGGGNGDYTYTNEYGDPLKDSEGNYIVMSGEQVIATRKAAFNVPDLAKTYLELKGGCIAHAYGGGNNATITKNTTICINNESSDLVTVAKRYAAGTKGTGAEMTEEEVLSYMQEKTQLKSFQADLTSYRFNFARIFGGNNKATMAIRPTWNLLKGIARDVYSGGNRGNMTSKEGLLLEIPAISTLSVENLYGGCRMADVCPTVNGVYTPCENLPGYNFPNELSARVLVRGGDVNNVYGGNDITGKVYGGNAIGIYTTIRGDVYGSGNGAYAYTNNEQLKDNEIYNDFYYPLGDYTDKLDALNAFRPNAEQVSIRLAGKTKIVDGNTVPDYTIIKGAVYCGGNCSTLATLKDDPLVELKIGSYVMADKVFLGNNGEKMASPTILKRFASHVDDAGNFTESGEYFFNDNMLTDPSVFSDYMEGVTMNLQPSIVFDSEINGDPANYIDYTSYIGSFYCGGNVGSMAIPGKNTYKVDRGINIFDKFVGGCNNADVEESEYNAAYEGGVLGSKSERTSYTDGGKIKNRLEINLENLTIMPMRWNNDSTQLIWNTNKWSDVYTVIKDRTLTEGDEYYTYNSGTETYEKQTVGEGESIVANGSQYEKDNDFVPVPNSPIDKDVRLLGGNIYGGCYNSGHVNGNVVININEDVMKRDEVFGSGTSALGIVASGIELEDQRDDAMAVALSVFGAGCGEQTEIWGSTTVNLNKGYAFQIFGGGEQGVVGKKVEVSGEGGSITREYQFNPAYSSTVNLKGESPIYSSEGTKDDLAETEYIYGGGNEGDVCGNTYVNLGYGRIYDAFGGASDADIYGHTEVYIGRQPNGDGTYKDAFPWIRDIVYGGNDFGGTIRGNYEEGYDFTKRVRNFAADHTTLHGSPTDKKPGVLKSSSYVEYLQGRVDTIFGGGYGNYDYNNKIYEGSSIPYQESAYVNIRPKANGYNHIKGIFGGGTGHPSYREGDKSQDRSYVLIDIPKNGGVEVENFKETEIFGAGSYSGLGLSFNTEATFADSFDPDQLSAIIDLIRGKVNTVFGGSYNEGVTARTVINVPEESTINIRNIFGGAYGTHILPPCDVYESNINYDSDNATVTGAIYGGNNNERRTLYTKVNISSPVWSDKAKGYTATVFGAGKGIDTWSEYTEVNLYDGAKVYEVYGGGEMGHVLNAESVQKYMQLYAEKPSPQISKQDPKWSQASRWTGEVGSSKLKTEYQDEWAEDWADAWTLGDYYIPNATYTNYANNTNTNLTNKALVTHDADMDDRDYTGYSNEEKKKRQYRYNTNVLIHEGATVDGYAYGGGLGDTLTVRTGDVYGTTYIALLGGKVVKDIYAAGTAGAVYDLFGMGAYNATTNPNGFTASANAYIKGGSCRNVYGGGWQGDVGHHNGTITTPITGPDKDDPTDDDVFGETHVVIGDLSGSSFTSGIPTVQRNAYGGGEGGAVYGTAYLTLNNGYVGYQYNAKGTDDPETEDIDERYEEKIEDDTKATPNTFLTDAGCLFGGGYIDDSCVDKTKINVYGGHVRGSLFGGGEIAAIGRATMNKITSGGKTTYKLGTIGRPGKTNIEMYGGHVHRNVYGGGRGCDNLGNHGSLHCDGFVFGQTEVHIHGGEVGTISGIADGNGNVFGGGDEGHVYSAYEKANGEIGIGKKDGERYVEPYQGYYYKYENDEFVTVDVAEEGEPSKYERQFTEDCKVLIEPHLKVTTAVTINGHDYKVGEYATIDDLNTLQNKNADEAKWDCLDPTGIIIHNAVFAGGNTPTGSLTTGANTSTVFGNATASINDIFHRDMITLGTRHTGGLYGDGNLTLVDGYRELNITNYGTDYYSIAKEIDINTYHALPDREAAYYELNYTCKKTCKDKNNTIYNPEIKEDGVVKSKAATITADDMLDLFLVYNETKQKYESFVYEGEAVLIWNEAKKEWEPNPDAGYWEESGVLPVYAGRLMNSIQRADFCGVWGSRMVMQGAQDRVPEEADYTNYTINRVREVSLNKKTSTAGDATEHGNYFGIYNIVNYLGALTSDVDFGDETSGAIRKTDSPDATNHQCAAGDGGKAYGVATYYDWKKAFYKERKRNNGSSHNKVALASGVYLELTTEESTGTGLYEKVWGPITGVIELDLINVSPGIGGGFVYAKNIHGIRKPSGRKNTTLTTLNKDAVTRWDYIYNPPEALGGEAVGSEDTKKEWQTSGNFVHSTQTIIDDCYNISNKYKSNYLPPDGVPAHYWYIKGSTYVYDQYISAYTGSSNAFSETVDIPLTIAAASHGRLKLLNVMPNRYAYYASPGVALNDGQKMIINDKTYYKNDPISYWDWYLLSKYEKELFVEKTYVNCMTCKIGDTETVYEAGTYIMTETEFNTFKSSPHTYKDADGEPILKADKTDADDDYIFRSSNNVSHDTGYILTYEVNNPSIWDNWYTPKTGDKNGKKTSQEYSIMDAATKANYEDGPTYHLDPTKVTGDGILLGQRNYKKEELIPLDVYSTYQNAKKKLTDDAVLKDSAHFEKAYIITNKITVTEDGHEHHYNPGVAVSYTFANEHGIAIEDNEAYICTNSIQVTKEEMIYKNSKMSKKEVDTYITDVNSKMNTIKTGASTMTLDGIKGDGSITEEDKKTLEKLYSLREDLKTHLVPAFYCTTAGLYGGNYYEKTKNYRGLEAWSSLSAADHDKFIFNYDALDLLIDPTYNGSEGQKYQYDGAYDSEEAVRNVTTGNPAGYSVTQSVDYTASYNNKDHNLSLATGVTVKRGESTLTNVTTLIDGDELERDVYESLPNEQRHYSPVAVTTVGKYYVVNAAFQVGATPYAVGEVISEETYNSLPDKTGITALTIDEAHKNQTYYFCRESYTPSGGITTISSTAIDGAGPGLKDGKVTLGTLISSDQYTALPNDQKDFTIHGISPTETSTLFVSRESDIYDLSKEKIITVIYKYDYDEIDGSGNVTPISERHVVNIHLTFKSGVPIVEDITQPDLILPGDIITLREPNVTPGAYEVTGGGWELFETQRDAESHTNGVDYDPTFDPLYWYQDGYFVAYYAKSYLGRTYSNSVPVSVANYHDMADVMSDANKEHHMYIDNTNVKRNPKIYINDYSTSDKNGLDLFKNLYELSLITGSGDGYTVVDGKITAATGTGNTALVGHSLLGNQTRAERNLEFFIRTDIDHSKTTWTPIGDETQCFEGVLHGDGHTISGLDHSLFKNLCGEVYNLGVTGSFTGAGLVDKGTGYVESCWVKTSATSLPGGDSKTNAVFGNPTDTKGYQLVNTYFWNGNNALYNTTTADGVTTSGGERGKARAMSEAEFYNGTVAYDLNNFYLYKRYSDKKTSANKDKAKYRFFTIGEDDNLTLQTFKYYDSNPELCSSGTILDKDTTRYVEDRFKDGDFRYAAGNIPTEDDERHWIETVVGTGGQSTDYDHFSPIWPDDYIFFGQKLTYGWASEAHQDVPTAVVRDGGRLAQNENANRVYRAPAYFRSKKMEVAHFNPRAYLAQNSADGTKEAYPGMTAIDFADHRYYGTYTSYETYKTYDKGWNNGWFYQPLLDDDGLQTISNCDETQNLLVYAPAESSESGYANKKTYDALTYTFVDPAYNDYYDNSNRYRIVGESQDVIYGHLVKHNLMATNDHLLVDLQDFNAPLAYTFDGSHRMWYQRKPADKEFVDRTKGWQCISLPFTAELVTTHQKGEITHFYSGSKTSENGTGSKIGHEYWLREFNNIKEETIEIAETPTNVAVADFTYPGATDGSKTVTNHFLWDYYYKESDRKDKNSDIYQEYYRNDRTFTNYSLLAAAKPYILGLPGQTYYEFDLSGKFEAQNTYTAIDRLSKQVVTFASDTGIGIGVSDDEMGGTKVKHNTTDYYFKPSYMNIGLKAGTNSFVMNADGDRYNKVPETGDDTKVSAFRPYFTATSTSGSRGAKSMAKYIVFDNTDDGFGEEHESEEIGDGKLFITSRLHHIIVQSTLKRPRIVSIYNAAGIRITTFVINPGQTVETRVNFAGVYIVNQTKIAVR